MAKGADYSMYLCQHEMAAARQIGRRPGTGHSAGPAYLDTTLDQRFYTTLWEVRSVL